MKSANTADNRINGDDVHGNDDGKSSFTENSQLTYNNTAAVKREGVYYLSYIYEEMTSDKLATEKENEDKNKDYESLDKNLKYEHMTTLSLKGGRRALKIHDGTTTNKAFNVGYEELKKKNKVVHVHRDGQSDQYMKKHMIISGTISFRNTHGYLSAQDYDNIQYNAIFLAVFVFLAFMWTLGVWRYKDRAVPIHYMIMVVLYACIAESLFKLIYYKTNNDNPRDYPIFSAFTTISDVIRSVCSRVIVLLAALGQHITISSASDQHVNIGIMMFLYAVSLVYSGINEHRKESGSVTDHAFSLGQMPNYIINVMIFVWIMWAFRTTLEKLRS